MERNESKLFQAFDNFLFKSSMACSKKLLSLTLVFVMLFTSFSNTAFAENGQSGKIVYVDGIKFVATVKNWEIALQSVGTKEIAKLKLDKFGNGTLQGVKELKPGEVAVVDLETLNPTSIDVKINKNNKLLTEFNSINDLQMNTYTGQDLVIGGTIILAATVIEALILASLCITIAGVMCYAVEAVIEDVRKNEKYYYKAFGALNTVVIDPIAISYTHAVNRIKGGNSIYTYNGPLAYNAVSGAGKGVIGPENHFEWWKIGKYYDHYHTGDRNGSHAWFGIPK